jgi:hypothetical protein
MESMDQLSANRHGSLACAGQSFRLLNLDRLAGGSSIVGRPSVSDSRGPSAFSKLRNPPKGCPNHPWHLFQELPYWNVRI